MRGAAQAERLVVGRTIERVLTLGWERGVILSDCKTAVSVVDRARPRALPPGWALRWVPRHKVQLAHRVARRELRLYRGR